MQIQRQLEVPPLQIQHELIQTTEKLHDASKTLSHRLGIGMVPECAGCVWRHTITNEALHRGIKSNRSLVDANRIQSFPLG